MSFIIEKLVTNIFCNKAEDWQIGFQDPASPVFEAIRVFHNDIWVILIFVMVLTFWMLFRCLFLFDENKNSTPSKITHHAVLEIVWTLLPALALLLVSSPSMALLYSIEEMVEPELTIKAIGHQWYWEYEYSDLSYLQNADNESSDELSGNYSFNSYLLSDQDSRFTEREGSLRLLEVDRQLVLPVDTHIRVIISSSDVLHSWAVPSLGVKLDACPGRLNQTNLYIKRLGLFYGQCSEICGVNHGFMPIVIRSIDVEEFDIFEYYGRLEG